MMPNRGEDEGGGQHTPISYVKWLVNRALNEAAFFLPTGEMSESETDAVQAAMDKTLEGVRQHLDETTNKGM